MNFTKKIAMLFIAALVSVGATAQDKKPASPAATAAGKINGATITVNYSSPSVKGRAIWGELVPYGKVWRAGANAPTTFETDKMLMVEGKELPAGKYALYMIPEKDNVIVVFGKDTAMGANNYDMAKDQVRVTVNPKKSKMMTESLIYKINKDNVTLSWENWDIPVMIK